MPTWLVHRLADASWCLSLTTTLVGAAATLSWAELVYLARKSKDVHQRYVALPDARLGFASAVGLVALTWCHPARFGLLLVLAGTILVFAHSVSFGREGSDEIAVIIVVPLAIATSPIGNSTITTATLLFLAGQLGLAYAASGGAKLLGPKWRSGRAVAQVLSTRDYGIGRRSLHHSRSWLLRSLAWGTIVFELTLPLLFVLGRPVLVAAIILGISFHVSVALTMRLNRFVLWFVAAYPAAAWASLHYGILS